MTFYPASFRRFVSDLIHGPRDIVPVANLLPIEPEPCKRCEADAAAVDALNDDELTALARVLGVYVPSAGEIAADFDMWDEEVRA